MGGRVGWRAWRVRLEQCIGTQPLGQPGVVLPNDAGVDQANMPPDGYTTVTISTEAAAKRSEVMMHQDLESMGLSMAFAADYALEQETMFKLETKADSPPHRGRG